MSKVKCISIPIQGVRFAILTFIAPFIGVRIAAFILFKNNKDFII
ncbi:hypothetical protein ACFSSE_12585 [Pedobacter alpinus]|uniref:Uncharacterized protein n=2 Tax=Pedobacter alpinus TaxID=1590643 RepID=A0ABW5TTD6_9SPHI